MRITTALLISVSATIVLWLSTVVVAAPSAECRALAKQFSEKPETLDTSQLARLRTCVSDELALKVGDAKSVPAGKK